MALLASAFLDNNTNTVSVWPFLLASNSGVTPSHVCMFTSAPTGMKKNADVSDGQKKGVNQRGV